MAKQMFKSSWYKDPESLPELQERWAKGQIPVPVITRYLNQRQLHDLVNDLVDKQLEYSTVQIVGYDISLQIIEVGGSWIVFNPSMGTSIDCRTVKCVEDALEKVVIGNVSYKPAYGPLVQIYRQYFPFYRSADQKAVLDRYFTKETFSYPDIKTSEKDYLIQLEAENQQLKETLSKILPREISGLASEYYQSPEQTEPRRFLETSLPNASTIIEYLGLPK